MVTDCLQATGLALFQRDLVVRPGCMHADVTHLCLQAIYLPYELSSGMTRQAREEAVLSLHLNNRQCRAVNVPENERLLEMLFTHGLTKSCACISCKNETIHYASQQTGKQHILCWLSGYCHSTNSTYCIPENINI